MKNRAGFVSNSSSSSFIVAVENPKSAKIKVEIDLAELAAKVTTPSQLKECFIDEYGKDFADDAEITKLYQDCLEQLSMGNTVLIGCVTNEDTPESYIIYEKGIPDNNKDLFVIKDVWR